MVTTTSITSSRSRSRDSRSLITPAKNNITMKSNFVKHSLRRKLWLFFDWLIKKKTHPTPDRLRNSPLKWCRGSFPALRLKSDRPLWVCRPRSPLQCLQGPRSPRDRTLKANHNGSNPMVTKHTLCLSISFKLCFMFKSEGLKKNKGPYLQSSMAFCCRILRALVVKARLAFVWVAFEVASSCFQRHQALVGAFLAWAEIEGNPEPQLRQPPEAEPRALSSGIQE